MDWTEKHDKIIVDGLKHGLPARVIADNVGHGVSRNAVLGRIHRQKLYPKVMKRYKPRTMFGGRTKTAVQVEDVIDRIIDLKDLGMTWREIGDAVGVSLPCARLWAIQYGGYDPIQRKHFTPEDLTYIANAYSDHVSVEEIADTIGRSYGVIRQKVLQLQKAGVITGYRDPQRTRLLRQYGAIALKAGATPGDALAKIADAKRQAFANVMNEARKAKTHFKEQAMEEMMADIAAGVDRNEAIFKARAKGVTLMEISDCFGLTRERVRQICAKQAEIIVLEKLAGEQ